MLNGREISEVKLSEIKESVSTFRLDSEYFYKQFLKDKLLVDSNPSKFTKFNELKLSVDGSAFYPALEPYYNQGSLPFLRVADVNKTIDFENCVKIPEEILPNFPTLKLVEKGDIVLTKGGSIGRAGLVTGKAAVTRDLIFINSATLSETDYTFLALYFQTDFCQRLMIRSSSMSVQPHLTITLIRDLPILVADNNFKIEITNLVNQSQTKLEESKSLYAEAENLLLSELGLRDWQPTNEQISVKSFSDFMETGRLDAEHYQPKYDYALAKLKELKPSAIVSLDDLLDVITNGQTPLRHDLSLGEVAFLTAEHIFDFRVNYNSEKRVTLEQHQGQLAKTEVRKGDVLITIKGKIGNAAVVEDVPQPTNINQDVGLLRLKAGVNPYFVAGFINSVIGKMFSEQISTGQINPFLGLGNLRTVPIPIFDNGNEIGEKLKQKVIEAENVSQESKQLLELAKRAVEIAIEQDENAALALIKAGF